MAFGLVHAARLARAGAALARWRLLPPPEHAHQLPFVLRLAGVLSLWLGRHRTRGMSAGARLAKALEGLGPTYVKLGQMLATRPDVLGAKNALDLQQLQDRLKPFSQEAAEMAIRKDLGQPIDALFESLGPAVAAASVAQVHKARIRHPWPGEPLEVAVKILRPGVERRCAREVAALRWVARWAEALVPASRRLEPVRFVETLAAAIKRELDLRMEAAGADELRERARPETDLVIPRVAWSRTGKRVMTLEWIDGVKLNDHAGLDAAGWDKARLARRLVGLFLTHAMREGVFHADMHPGNLFALPDGRIAFVDFGIIGRLDRGAQRYLAEILWAFFARDYDRAAAMHFEAGYVPEHQTRADFAQALRGVIEPVQGKRAAEMSMARTLMHLFEITAMFDMRLRPELVMLQKTMVTVEGVARGLDPQFDVWEAAREPVEAFVAKRLGAEAYAKEAARGVNELARLAVRLPDLAEQSERALNRLGSGEIALSDEALRRIATALHARGRWWRRFFWMAVGAGGVWLAIQGF